MTAAGIAAHASSSPIVVANTLLTPTTGTGQVRDRAGADAVLVVGGEEADLGVLEKLGGEGVALVRGRGPLGKLVFGLDDGPVAVRRRWVMGDPAGFEQLVEAVAGEIERRVAVLDRCAGAGCDGAQDVLFVQSRRGA